MDGERVDVVYGPQLEVPQEGDVASEASVEEPQVEVAAETVGFVSQEPSVAGDAAESTPAAMYARRRQGHIRQPRDPSRRCDRHKPRH